MYRYGLTSTRDHKSSQLIAPLKLLVEIDDRLALLNRRVTSWTSILSDPIRYTLFLLRCENAARNAYDADINIGKSGLFFKKLHNFNETFQLVLSECCGWTTI
jgi:hypothetical protein